MADVYRARVIGFRGFSRTIAIKRIHPHLLERERFVRMFTDEAKIASQLVHPNIVQIHELGEEAGVPFIAMELVPGQDLYHVQRRLVETWQSCPWRMAIRIVLELCAGLQYAHDFRRVDGEHQEIVHRDVSPRNVLISFTGEVKLTDFGVARARDREEETRHGLIKGKVRYISPEGATGKPVDRRSDIFSLGIVFAEMLTMRQLREGPSDISILTSIREGRVDREQLSGVTPILRRIVDRALAPDPDQRYPDAVSLRDELLDVAKGELAPMTADELGEFMRRLFAEEYQRDKEHEQEVDRAMTAARRPGGVLADGRSPGRLRPIRRGDQTGGAADALPDEDAAGELVEVPPLPAAATPTATEAPQMEGDLSRTSLVRILHHLAVEEASGRLDLRRDPVQKSVFFEDGEPVFVESNVGAELFGEHLVARGVLERADQTRALDLAADEATSFIEALLKLQIFPPHQLYRHLADQVRDRILDLFTWTAGRFAFFDNAPAPEWTMPLGLRSHRMIHEGVRDHLPLVVVRRALSGLVRGHLTRVGGELPPFLQLTGREQRILRTIELERCTVSELLRKERDEEQVLRLVYLLSEIERLAFTLPS